MTLQEIFAGCTAKPLLAEEPMAKHTSFRIGDTGNNLSHFTIIGTGVHINSTANAAGNAHSKLHAAQAQLCRLAGSSSQRNTTAKSQRAAISSNIIQHIAQLDNQAADTLITHQQVRTIANQRNRHLLLPACA